MGSTNFIRGLVEGRHGDGWTVRTADGSVVVHSLVDVGEGDRCVVCIRPEYVEVLPDGSGLVTNTFNGEVGTRLLTWDAMDHQVHLPNVIPRAAARPGRADGAREDGQGGRDENDVLGEHDGFAAHERRSRHRAVLPPARESLAGAGIPA